MPGPDKNLIGKLPIVLAIVLPMLDLGDRVWGSASTTALTAYQVIQLTDSLQKTNTRLDAITTALQDVPRQSAFDKLSKQFELLGDKEGIDHDVTINLTGRLDGFETRLNELKDSLTTGSYIVPSEQFRGRH